MNKILFFCGILTFGVFFFGCDLLPKTENKLNNEDADKALYYKMLEYNHDKLMHENVELREIVNDYKARELLDTVIIDEGGSLWGTLGIKSDEESVAFAKEFGFKYFYDDWDRLIVYIPIGMKFVYGWRPLVVQPKKELILADVINQQKI